MKGYNTSIVINTTRPEDSPEALAFYATIAASPDSGFLRGEFADWLEERAGTEACDKCTAGVILDYEPDGSHGVRLVRRRECPTCSGTGFVPDRTARLARGYRALGEYGLTCCNSLMDGKEYKPEMPVAWFTSSHRGRLSKLYRQSTLPGTWYARLEGFTAESDDMGWRDYPNMKAGDDAAALAWCAMTDAERAACDEELRIALTKG